MNIDNDDDLDAPLSEDPEENLRLENELLHLKLKAELGAESQSFDGIPPEVENEFLKNVLAFEHAAANAKQVTLYELVGKPFFTPAGELDDAAIETALEEVIVLLREKNVEADFIAEYDNRTKYAFITEELFGHEVDDFMLPGMVMHFTYEEFHPNHRLDISNRANEFVEAWFEQKLGDNSWELAKKFILPGGQTLDKTEAAVKLKNFFDCYTQFADCEYLIENIAFELQDENGMGYAEGNAKYTAHLENHEKITIEGPFKLYLSLEHGWWSIFYFVFPGFGF